MARAAFVPWVPVADSQARSARLVLADRRSAYELESDTRPDAVKTRPVTYEVVMLLADGELHLAPGRLEVGERTRRVLPWDGVDGHAGLVVRADGPLSVVVYLPDGQGGVTLLPVER